MAERETTVPLSALWNNGNSAGALNGIAVKKITDGESGQDTFEVDESITAHVGSQ